MGDEYCATCCQTKSVDEYNPFIECNKLNESDIGFATAGEKINKHIPNPNPNMYWRPLGSL